MINLEKLKIRFYSSYKVDKFREKCLSLCTPHKQTKIIFILGCQRSGTTIIQQLVSMSPLVKYHGEGELPYFYDADGEKSFRFKSTNDIEQYTDDEAYDFIALKPLYESHNIEQLLSDHEGSKAIWVFRNYNDVIKSHLNYYNFDAIDYIRPVFNLKIKSWINEYVPQNVSELLKQLSIDELSDADAYALFWLLRSSIYLNISESHKNKVLLINYEDLISMPEQQTSRLFNFLDIAKKSFFYKIIRSGIVKNSYNFKINPIIKIECDRIYKELYSHC